MTAPDQSCSPRLVPSTNLVTVHAAAAEEHGAAMRRRRLDESGAFRNAGPGKGRRAHRMMNAQEFIVVISRSHALTI
jgi:hypothetical protein